MNTRHDTIGSLVHDAAFEFPFRVRQPRPLRPKKCVLLLHGVGGNEMSLAELATSIDPDTLLILPRAPRVLAADQFAWFRVAFTASGPSIVEAEAEASRRRLIRFVEQVQAQFAVEPKDIVIAGFSQGGIMSASVALSAPEQVGGFAILSGRILPELKPHLASRERLAHLRSFIGHGEHDRTLPVVWSQRADQWLSELGVEHVTRLYPIAHGISDEMKTDFAEWLAQ
jgi:phospholipase/carboxylesterase